MLGDSFVIFCGSAISGVLPPYAPMVTKVEQTLLECAARKLNNGSKSSQLVAKYALSLAEKHGRYRTRILDTTKFEDFIWGLTNIVGKHRVDELLRILYQCDADEYGPNHSAIGFLLQQRVCLACLTTNFDNAIELSKPRHLAVLDYRSQIQHVPNKSDAPVLLKLHGDASSNTCVATSTELARAGIERNCGFLQTLLSGHKVLVVGYSGTGDVDIAPHLRAADAKLFWCDYTPEKIPRFRPDQRNVLSDLSLRTGETRKGMKNLLVTLAEHHGWSSTRFGSEHQWQDEMERWVNETDMADLERFVISRLSWVTSWPHVHMATYKFWEAEKTDTLLELETAYTQVAAYHSAKKVANQLLNREDLDQATHAEVQSTLGFISWRESKYKQALEIFRPLLDPNLKGQSRVIADVSQNYVETVLEMLRYEPDQAKRSQLIQDTEVMSVAEKLRQVNEAVGLDYLARIALYMLEHYAGSYLDEAEILEFFEECCAMEEWPTASLTTQMLFSLSFPKGVYALVRVSRKLLRRRNWKLFIKNVVAAIHAKTGRHLIPLIRLIDGRSSIQFFVALVEFEHRRKLRVWKREWNKAEFRVE